MFEWSDARIFLEVCSKLSFTAAAKDLAMDQTTVGRRIAALEAALDTKLFRRGANGLALTPSGEEARALAEQMESAALALAGRVGGRDGVAQGLVRLTTFETFGRAFLAPRLGALRARAPDVELVLTTDNRTLNLSRREADLAIRNWKPSQPGLRARKIGQTAFSLYASPSYLGAHALQPQSHHSVLGFDDELAAMPDAKWLSSVLREGDPTTAATCRFPLRSNSRAVLESAAASGLGIAILPCYLADGRDDLRRLDESEPPVVRDLWLVVHSEMQEQARVRAVIDFIVEEVAAAKDLLLGRSERKDTQRRSSKTALPRRSP